MPTYFGPCNLPPLEAFALGVPVLYPDEPGLRDQVGDAALLMDLSEPRTMADHLISLLRTPGVSKQLCDKGTARLYALEGVDRVQILQSVIEGFQRKRMCWSD